MLARAPSRKAGLRLLPCVILVALAVAAAACGGDGGGETSPAGETPAAVTREVTQKDTFFDPDQFAASPGQEITFSITNAGQATHNMRIAGPDGEFQTEDDAVVAPLEEGGLAPGNTASLRWTAPDQAGAIKFRCDFHPSQMTGTITVAE